MADAEAFIAELEEFVANILFAGRINSLSQDTADEAHQAPGVPDLSIRVANCGICRSSIRIIGASVEYGRRRQLLAELEGLDVAAVMERMDEGLPKLWMIQRALRLRGAAS